MRRKFAREERGVALLSVLWVGMILGALAAAILALGRSDLDLVRSQRAQIEAELAADDAVRTAIYAIMNRADSAIAPDGSVAGWRRTGAAGTVELRVEITSEHGRLDLNRAGRDSLAALLVEGGAEAGEAQRLAAAVADFTDEDDFAIPGGAERSDYAGAGLPGPKNAPFERAAELLGVLGMTPALYRRIADAVTVHSGRTTPLDGQQHPLVRAALTGVGAEPPGLLPPAFRLELGASPETLRPGSTPAGGDLLRIRAEAESESGARVARIAIISLRARSGSAYSVLVWRRATPALFPLDPREEAVAAGEPPRGG